MKTPINDAELLVEYLDVCGTAMAAEKESLATGQRLDAAS